MSARSAFSTIARAMAIMSSSVPSYLNALTAHRTNRQFPGTYPSEGTILSMLGENAFGPHSLRPTLNSMLVTAHRPVHVSMAHSFVRAYGTFFCFARYFA